MESSHVRSRTRDSAAFDLAGHRYLITKDGTTTINRPATSRNNFSIMFDKVNPLWVRHRGGGRFSRLDLGYPMSHYSVTWDFPVQGYGVGGDSSSIKYRYDGPIIAYPYPNVLAPVTNDPERVPGDHRNVDPLDHRIGLGGQAIAACRPAQPEAAFGQTLVELVREGIPSILQRFDVRDIVDSLRGAGKNYLNVEFGWRPLVSDLRDACRLLVTHEKIMDDLYRHNGRPLKRRYSLPASSFTVKETDKIYPWPTLSTSYWTQKERVQTTTYTTRTWFSGEFIYRLPKRSDRIGVLGAKARYLLGVDLTPELLWQIAPWTWLSDWFVSYGDLISNVTAISSDDLVMRYGYLMQESKTERTTTHLGVKTRGYGSVSSTVEGRLVLKQQTRIRASPYGFGLTDTDLTDRQRAILVALGLSRSGR